MSLHSIARTFHIISLHSMSFWDPELLIFKIVNPDLILKLSKLISKPWVFKFANLSHFTPRTWNYKSFLKKTIWMVSIFQTVASWKEGDTISKDLISNFYKRALNFSTSFKTSPKEPFSSKFWNQAKFLPRVFQKLAYYCENSKISHLAFISKKKKWCGTRLEVGSHSNSKKSPLFSKQYLPRSGTDL